MNHRKPKMAKIILGLNLGMGIWNFLICVKFLLLFEGEPFWIGYL